ncbi:unnamed protein product [Linum tenue]|uniref:Uncharacterized protein n=1 Tax=Linum tenue TaxID=586396 RepID=A0AAV0H7Z4_9ROSI|nr:unnamed protein product [Linum tenue]
MPADITSRGALLRVPWISYLEMPNLFTRYALWMDGWMRNYNKLISLNCIFEISTKNFELICFK